MLFAIPSYFCVYSLPPSHVFHIVFFFLENLNTEVLHLIGLILVVPIQGFIFCYSVLLFKGLADLTSPDLQVTIIYELSCIYSFASCSWTLYKLLVIRIVHDCFIIVCYIVHTFSPPFCWKWKIMFLICLFLKSLWLSADVSLSFHYVMFKPFRSTLFLCWILSAGSI